MLYLASQSPQRRRLLQDADIAFTCIHSSCDEESVQDPLPVRCATHRARCKAMHADLRGKTLGIKDAVLGVDTIAILHDDMIGKPRDRDDARRILGLLQGTTHRVVSCHSLWRPASADLPELLLEEEAETRVHMRAMSETEISDYVNSGESDDRAGAYAIQETGDRFVDQIAGDFDTVVGLSIRMLRDLLQRAGIAATDQ